MNGNENILNLKCRKKTTNINICAAEAVVAAAHANKEKEGKKSAHTYKHTRRITAKTPTKMQYSQRSHRIDTLHTIHTDVVDILYYDYTVI